MAYLYYNKDENYYCPECNKILIKKDNIDIVFNCCDFYLWIYKNNLQKFYIKYRNLLINHEGDIFIVQKHIDNLYNYFNSELKIIYIEEFIKFTIKYHKNLIFK